MTKKIRIHVAEGMQSYFFSKNLQNLINGLSHFLGSSAEINLFSEATLKTNKMPNGILIKSDPHDGILLPALLRDPGCGFLLFKICNVPLSEIKQVCHEILTHCQDLESAPCKEKIDFMEVVEHGISHLPIEQERFSNKKFTVDIDSLYSEITLEELSADINQVSNTVEVKVPNAQCDQQTGETVDLFGFIHSGSIPFPRTIYEEYVDEAMDYSFRNNLADIDSIGRGFYGFPINSDEGYEFMQSVFAAMNYCIYKRWHFFSKLEMRLSQRFNLEMVIINDRCHAGLFKQEKDGKSYFLQSRGVQLSDPENPITLIAGQKESVSFLLNNCPAPFIGHGTSYVISPQMIYSQPELKEYDFAVDEIVSNVSHDQEKMRPYNFNILQQVNRLESEAIPLYPLLNYHGRYLREAL